MLQAIDLWLSAEVWAADRERACHLPLSWFEEKLAAGVCEATGAPFDLSLEPHRPKAPWLIFRDYDKRFEPENAQLVTAIYASALGRRKWGHDAILRWCAALLRPDLARKLPAFQWSICDKEYRRYVRGSWAQARKRAEDFAIPFTLTYEEWEAKVRVGRCSVTGLPFRRGGGPFAPSPDQIIPRGGYTPENVRAVIWAFNQGRSNWRDEDVREMAEGLFRHSALALGPRPC